MRWYETQDLLSNIDAYVEGLFAPPDPALENGSLAPDGRVSFSLFAVG